MTRVDKSTVQDFCLGVTEFYGAHGRHDLPWRQPSSDGVFDPYFILVSEIMLQQTQVARVIPKYQAFLETFPLVQSLAAAELGDVLRLWSGLGYNRRAKFLWQAAQMVVADFGGVFPSSAAELERLPGVGRNTAGAILAYAYNQPVVFIETNIRSVYIHHFFKDDVGVPDAAIAELVAASLPGKGAELSPREWYWALMDYGSYLKQSVGNASRAAKAYSKQSKFEGSRRQVRGQVLRLLGEAPQTRAGLAAVITDDRLDEVLVALEVEGLIRLQAGQYHL